ncbi:hypothetical protein IMZ48_28540 [Candidatus Bathyarchaeota archaeon]|nr:hypothetical protein [Candidatus Bathyarchaeota archaeon]
MLTRTKWYIDVIAKETKQSLDDKVSFRERQEVQRLASSTDSYWGYLWLELNLPAAKDLEAMTLSDIAEIEFATLEDILRRAARKMLAGSAIQQ